MLTDKEREAIRSACAGRATVAEKDVIFQLLNHDWHDRGERLEEIFRRMGEALDVAVLIASKSEWQSKTAEPQRHIVAWAERVGRAKG